MKYIYNTRAIAALIPLMMLTTNNIYPGIITVYNMTRTPLSITYKTLTKTYKHTLEPGLTFTKKHNLTAIKNIAVMNSEGKPHKVWVKEHRLKGLLLSQSAQCYGPITELQPVKLTHVWAEFFLYEPETKNNSWNDLKQKTVELGLCPAHKEKAEKNTKEYSETKAFLFAKDWQYNKKLPLTVHPYIPLNKNTYKYHKQNFQLFLRK